MDQIKTTLKTSKYIIRQSQKGLLRPNLWQMMMMMIHSFVLSC